MQHYQYRKLIHSIEIMALVISYFLHMQLIYECTKGNSIDYIYCRICLIDFNYVYLTVLHHNQYSLYF